MSDFCSPSLDHNTLCEACADGAVAPVEVIDEVYYRIAAQGSDHVWLPLITSQTRWVAVAALPGLLGATWAHLGNGWLFSAYGGGWEYPALLTLLALIQALTGNRSFALPSALRLSWQREESAV